MKGVNMTKGETVYVDGEELLITATGTKSARECAIELVDAMVSGGHDAFNVARPGEKVMLGMKVPPEGGPAVHLQRLLRSIEQAGLPISAATVTLRDGAIVLSGYAP